MTEKQGRFLTIWTGFLMAGIRDSSSIEAIRKTTVVNLFSAVGFSITSVLSIQNVLIGQGVLSLPLVIAASLFLTSHLYLRLSYSKNAYAVSSILLQSVLLSLCLYLVLHGGKNGTGPLWMYLVPPVVLFFSGLKNGLTIIGLFVLTYCLIVFSPSSTLGAYEYSFDFKTRILYSFLTLVFLAGFYEYSREASYEKLALLTKELELQATLDPLTQLLNRRGLLDRFTYEISRSLRCRHNLSVILIDIDFFKKINDHYGHDTGDKALVALAQLFSKNLRQQDYIARWGGEEFLFLLPQADINQATMIAEKIRHKVAQHFFAFDGIDLKLSISLGVAQLQHGQLAQEVINIADQRLYCAKEFGRNQVVST